MTKSNLLRSDSERKFTPPTEFPAEYMDRDGNKAVVLGRAPVGDYPLIGYVLHTEGGPSWPDCSSPEGWTEDGQRHTDWPSPEDLHDIPKRITGWHNVYDGWISPPHSRRGDTDLGRNPRDRLCVYRISRNEDGSDPEIFMEEV